MPPSGEFMHNTKPFFLFFIASEVRSFKNGLLRTVIGSDGKEQLPVDPDRECMGTVTGTCQLSGKN